MGMTKIGDKKRIGPSCFNGEDCPAKFNQVGVVIKIDQNDRVEQTFTLKFADGSVRRFEERYCYDI